MEKFGGGNIPEMLHQHEEPTRKLRADSKPLKNIKDEFKSLLRDFVADRTPLYFAQSESSEKVWCKNLFQTQDLLSYGGALK